MEVVCDNTGETADNSGSPVAGENAQPEVNGHKATVKPAWKAKREEWVKPETDSAEQDESSVMDPNTSVNAAKDRAPHIILDEDNVNDVHNHERKKSLPPIKVPEKSAEIPVIVSRAVYNRLVLTLQNEVPATDISFPKLNFR